MRKLDDATYVAGQYRDATNLDARVQIYQRFGTNPQPWLAWLWERLALQPGEKVIDAGCGPANLWHEHRRDLPQGLRVTLADASQGMLDEAQQRLEGAPGFQRLRADVREMGVSEASFDVALCSHVLYHVPDPERAIAELRRVLRPRGRVVVGTNDWTHLIEMRELVDRFGLETAYQPVGRDSRFFDLENALDAVSAQFEDVTLERRRDELRVTDVDVLIAYVRSMTHESAASEVRLEELEKFVRGYIERAGAFLVTASVGVACGRLA